MIWFNHQVKYIINIKFARVDFSAGLGDEGSAKHFITSHPTTGSISIRFSFYLYTLSVLIYSAYYFFLYICFALDTKACPSEVQLPEIAGLVSCSLLDICTGIRCCASSSEVPTTFHTEVRIDVCAEKMTVVLERLTFSVGFDNITWGMYFLVLT